MNNRKSEHKKKSSRFSDFFLHASDDEKKRVFTEVAQQANEEQREVFKKSQLNPKQS